MSNSIARLLMALPLLAVGVFLAGAGRTDRPGAAEAYSTTGGFLEPDKCASAWVIDRFVLKGEVGGSPKATIKFFPPGATITEGVQFDTPMAKRYARQPSKSVMETIVAVHGFDDPALLRLAKVMRDIEINTWSEKLTPESAGLETIINGLNRTSKNEEECLKRSFVIFDALYAEFKGSAH